MKVLKEDIKPLYTSKLQRKNILNLEPTARHWWRNLKRKPRSSYRNNRNWIKQNSSRSIGDTASGRVCMRSMICRVISSGLASHRLHTAQDSRDCHSCIGLHSQTRRCSTTTDRLTRAHKLCLYSGFHEPIKQSRAIFAASALLFIFLVAFHFWLSRFLRLLSVSS